jgi:hypothetical protein
LFGTRRSIPALGAALNSIVMGVESLCVLKTIALWIIPNVEVSLAGPQHL